MKPFTTLASALFALIALAHLYRLIFGLSFIIAGCEIPRWASLIGLALSGLLAVMLRREAGKPD